jgi:aryl-alcohol dehydrogenase-like predicted oxidoreductase
VELNEKKGLPGSWSEHNNEFTWSLLDRLFAVAGEVGKTPAQVAINWLLGRSESIVPIIGARTMEHLEDNLGAGGWSLSAEHMAQLNEASDVPMSYPYEYIARLQRGR